MPTICIDCRYITGRPSGIGEMVARLIEYAPPMSTDLDYLLLRHAGRKEPLSNAPNVREIAVSSPANGPGTMWFLSRLVDLSGVDVFHAPANILPAGLGMKTLTTVHDIMWLTHPHWCNPRPYGWIETAFYQHGLKRALKCSDQITAVSAATRDAITAYAPETRDRCHVTLSGVSDDFHPLKRGDPAASCLVDRPFVLIVGQNAPYKNHANAMRAFAAACADWPEMQLALVQRRNSSRSALPGLARELGIADRVHFLGEVDQDMLVTLYSDAAALLHPSICEGFGNPLAEAMACGCPVVTSNHGAMAEITGGAAALVDTNDNASIAHALRSVLLDEQMAKSMSQAGLERAAQLRWDDFAHANIALYRELLG